MSGSDRRDEDEEQARQRTIEESLNEALSDLERMLQRHRQGGEAEAEAPPPADDDDQYTIPLLDDVVVPGVPVPTPEPVASDVGAGFDMPVEDDEPALRRRIAARLASEIEVIVQDRVETALEAAREEIREQVRNHMDIILPEVVDELIQARRRRGE